LKSVFPLEKVHIVKQTIKQEAKNRRDSPQNTKRKECNYSGKGMWRHAFWFYLESFLRKEEKQTEIFYY
jgi:hypothetical protein